MKWNHADAERFGTELVDFARRLFPAVDFEFSRPLDLVVNGHRFKAEDLFRMVQGEPARREEIFESHLRLFVGFSLQKGSPLPWTTAKPRLMPRIRMEEQVTRSGEHRLACLPFVNDTVISYEIFAKRVRTPVTIDDIKRWGISIEQVDLHARDNLARFKPEVDVEFVNSPDGGRLAVLSGKDGYDAARLLLDSLYEELCSELRGSFYVAIPSRDVFFAFTMRPLGFVDRMMRRFAELRQSSANPICGRPFIVTRDGVAGTIGRLA